MFYRIRDNKIYDYSQGKYADDCLETNIITQEELTKNPDKVIIKNGKLAPNPNWSTIELQQAKENKLNEALEGAKNFIENEACFQFDKTNSIEATDGNIGKLTAYALGFQTGQFDEVEWTSKEDNVITLNQEALLTVLMGLGAIQSNVWNVQYVGYKTQIEQAETVEAVNEIEVNYDNNINL